MKVKDIEDEMNDHQSDITSTEPESPYSDISSSYKETYTGSVSAEDVSPLEGFVVVLISDSHACVYHITHNLS